jgi:molybdopterin-guanine dinucleotide biosynthesis protein A
VAPKSALGPEPLCALYRREPALSAAQARLAAGRLALHELLDALRVHWLEGEDLAAVDPGGAALANVNSPDDLLAFRARAPA